jgi:molybdopterin molybdotransferase
MGPPFKPLMPLDEALASLLVKAVPLGQPEVVSSFEADGRILAADLVSALDVPAFANSSMDGYAMRAQDAPVAGAQLPVSQRIAAGQQPQALAAGTAARIFTGAPIPLGADCVVMQEECSLEDDLSAPGTQKIAVQRVPLPGQWVRPKADDVAKGQVVLRKGQRLGPAHLGLAASLGMAQLQVARRPRVALFSTGDELVMPGTCAPEALPVGAIFNSNRFFLRNLLVRLGADVQDFGIVPDQREATEQALQAAAQTNDLILTSGGVSVGEEDHVKPAVSALGHLDLWQLAIKPGKPFAYGTVNRRQDTVHGLDSRCHFIGLPGNPVSSFVTFLLLVRPFLLALQGMTAAPPRMLQATAAFDWRLDAQGQVELFNNQSSGVLTSLAFADVLVDNPPGATILKGAPVNFLLISELMA